MSLIRLQLRIVAANAIAVGQNGYKDYQKSQEAGENTMRNLGIILSIFVIFNLFIVGYGEGDILEKQKVTITYGFWADANQLVARREIVKDFESENPHITIKLQPTTGGRTSTVYQTWIVGRVAPDVMEMAGDWSRPFAAKGCLFDLNSLLEKEKELIDDYPQATLTALQYKGKQYALPMRMFPTVLYFNKYLFDEAGLDYPDENWTWNDFLKAARKLTKGKGSNKQFGCLGSDDPWFWIIAFGGKFANKERDKCLINNRESIDSIKFYKDLIHKYRVSPSPTKLQAGVGMGEMFMTGRGAMFFGSNYRLKQFRNIKQFRWGVTLVPKVEKTGKRYSINCVDGDSISVQSKHKKEAWEFVKYLSAHMALKEYLIPVRRSIPSFKIFQILDLEPSYGKVFLDAFKCGHIKPFSGGGEVNSLTMRELELVWLGMKSTAEACKKIEAEVNNLLKKGAIF